ncbi:MAG TPA: penicillin-binding protein 2 [Vicinamibacterales bacterium]|nr:penicillin-binding protein 2 [Vicinamibacterales bacterium]
MATTSLLPDDRRSLTLRLGVLQYMVALLFAALAVGFWIFQIAQHEKFREMAENNRTRRLPLPAPRGVLLDRDGKVLVENESTLNIGLVREQTKNIPELLRALAAATGVDELQLRDVVNRRRREPTYRPIVLIENASREQVIAMWARRLELPGVFYQEVPSRKYPAADMAAHLFGYVGEVTEPQLQRADYQGVEPGSLVGQAGIELSYNRQLMGIDGNKTVVVNSVGREIRALDELPPTTGHPLQLTIDADVQKATEDGFAATGFDGAAVVLDPRNGEVLSFTSRPAFDPNAFTAGIDRATWNSLINDPLKPLQNRALQGTYSPGSTFKMAVGLAGLEEGVITPDFHVHCGGGATFYGRYFKCWKKGGHGSIDLRHAIEQSCDVYFYTVGNMLGVDRINKWATLFGLGVKSNIDLPNELSGLVPSTEWKATHTKEKKWYAGETISVAIGQGQVSVTPVSLAVYTATLANGGTRVTPHLVKAADDGQGLKPVPPPPPQSKVEVSPEKLQAIRDGMWLVVNGGAGTATRAKIPGKDVCGKTGTAQVISNLGRSSARTTKNLRDHGWFTFFAPRDNPEIAGVVFLEHGIHSANAASVAKHILETYFAKKDGKPLPPPPTREDMRLDLRDPFARAAIGGGGQ